MLNIVRKIICTMYVLKGRNLTLVINVNMRITLEANLIHTCKHFFFLETNFCDHKLSINVLLWYLNIAMSLCKETKEINVIFCFSFKPLEMK